MFQRRHSKKVFFLVFKWNFLYFNLYPLLLVLPLDTTKQSLFTPSHWIFLQTGKIPLSLLFSRRNNYNSLSLSYERQTNLFNISVTLSLVPLQYVHVCLVLRSPEQSAVASPVLSHLLQLLPALFLMQPRRLFGCLCCQGHISQLSVHQEPPVFFCKAAFQLFGLQPLLVHEVVPLQVQYLAFSSELHEVHVAYFSRL